MGLVLLLVAAVAFIIVATAWLRLHAFAALLLAALGFGLAAGLAPIQVIESLKKGFGDTVGSIGFVIVAGTMIGILLEESGGAQALAERSLALLGERRAIPAVGLAGFIVSIPVFGDSCFLLLFPLARAIARRAGVAFAGCVISLSLGLTISHTLIPPTPGPIVGAQQLEADLGLVILLGIPPSLLAFLAACIFAVLYATRIPLDPGKGAGAAAASPAAIPAAERPAAAKALLPIVVPIILIVAKSIADLPSKRLQEGNVAHLVRFIGDPVIALLLGVGFALWLPKRFHRGLISPDGAFGRAVTTSGVIILITAAGGAFGRVLRDSGIAKTIGDALSTAHLGMWLPFILAAAIKTAQGSSTVAMITVSSLLSPMLPSLGLDAPVARALVVLSVGSGAMVASHANDSIFWVITQLAGMDVKTGYKLHTLGTALIGTVSAAVVWIMSIVLV